MKKSIAFLPKKNREDLKYLVELILDKIPVCEMITSIEVTPVVLT